MNRRDLAARVAAHYERPAVRHYVFWKVRSDPVYEAVAAALAGRGHPVADVGCGVGVLSLYLRERGLGVPVLGTDFDERKIEIARRAARASAGLEFRLADAGTPLPPGSDVVLLDLVQYLRPAEREALLRGAAAAVPAGGVIVIRTGILDRSWRSAVTRFSDAVARAARWLRAERIELPTREEIVAPFGGFEAEIQPLRGRTPFNNYLFVFRKPDAAQ